MIVILVSLLTFIALDFDLGTRRDGAQSDKTVSADQGEDGQEDSAPRERQRPSGDGGPRCPRSATQRQRRTFADEASPPSHLGAG